MRPPFMHTPFLDYAMNIDPKVKMPKNNERNIEKFIIRYRKTAAQRKIFTKIFLIFFSEKLLIPLRTPISHRRFFGDKRSSSPTELDTNGLMELR